MANRMNNDMAVSPIVATLVLIVVAVIGAVAVGTIMGTFSSDVSKKADTGDIAGASSTEILAAGSTTIQPAMQIVATEYMKANPAIKLTVQGGGSGAGLSAAANNVADIGMMSEDLTSTQKAAYPEIQQFKVGASGVVLITRGDTVVAGPYTNAQVKAAYDVGDAPSFAAIAPFTQVGTRSDKSGTADTFGKYLSLINVYNTPTANVVANNGNGAMVTWVKGASNRLGFTDYDYASTTGGIQVVSWENFAGTGNLKYTAANIKDGYNNAASTQFPNGATRPLFLITNGAPSSVVKDIITYAQSPGVKDIAFKPYNVTHISELVVA